MPSNLPPGVTDRMIPGNRAEDQEWEELHEEVDKDCEAHDIDGRTARILWRIAVASFTNKPYRPRGCG